MIPLIAGQDIKWDYLDVLKQVIRLKHYLLLQKNPVFVCRTSVRLILYNVIYNI